MARMFIVVVFLAIHRSSAGQHASGLFPGHIDWELNHSHVSHSPAMERCTDSSENDCTNASSVSDGDFGSFLSGFSQ